MDTHPHISSQIARDRHRDRLARAEQQRLARQLITASRSRQGERPARRLRGALRPARLRAVITGMTRQLAGAGQHQAVPPTAPPQS